MIIFKIEDTLKTHFQKTVKIVLGNSVIKQGKFILVKQNAFALDFYIKTNKSKLEILSLPIPFNFQTHDNNIVFDYELENITIKNSKTFLDISDYAKKNKTSKYFNNKLSLKFD